MTKEERMMIKCYAIDKRIREMEQEAIGRPAQEPEPVIEAVAETPLKSKKGKRRGATPRKSS